LEGKMLGKFSRWGDMYVKDRKGDYRLAILYCCAVLILLSTAEAEVDNIIAVVSRSQLSSV